MPSEVEKTCESTKDMWVTVPEKLGYVIVTWFMTGFTACTSDNLQKIYLLKLKETENNQC